MPAFDPEDFRQQFPLLQQAINGKPLVYFDNAATTQKFSAVIETLNNFYISNNANVHRGSHYLSAQATSAFELARQKVKSYINANSLQEVIWTKGATESINLVAQSWGSEYLSEGDEIVLSYGEHHANIVPWQAIAKSTGAIIKTLPLDVQGKINVNLLHDIINDKTKIVCCSHVSNVLGKLNPIEEIIARAKKFGALTLIDGAQTIAHYPVDVQALDCDFYVFSAHKFYGPTGVGVLYGKRSLLTMMTPYQYGGEMIKQVSFKQGTTFNDLPFKFEAGTPNIGGIIAFAKAIECFERYELSSIHQYEKELITYAYQQLQQIEQLKFIVQGKPDVGIFSFIIEGLHNQDVAAELDNLAIAIRNGHHCAMPLMEYLELTGCLRISLAPYNNKQEIDYTVKCLKQLINNKTSDLPNEQVIDNLTQVGNSTLQQVLANFNEAKGWDARHRQVMLYGKQLARLSKEQRDDKYLISGCESQAWLSYQKDTLGRLNFSADSDAKVIRGLLYIVLAAYHNKAPQDILTFDIEHYFTELGLMQHLSPSRGNGLLAIVARIKAIAKSENSH